MNLKVSILVTACLILTPLPAPGAEVRIGIEDIPAMAMTGSPLAVLLDSELGLA